MECVEIVLKDIKKKYLDGIMKELLKFDAEDIISSYFYDKQHNKELEFHDVESYEVIFDTMGTGTLFLEKTLIGIVIERVMIVIECDGELTDITINFEEGQFEKYKNSEMNDELRILFQKLSDIQKKYQIGTIIVGYEPAADEDMKIVEFRCGQVIINNENGFSSQFAPSCYDTLAQMMYHRD